MNATFGTTDVSTTTAPAPRPIGSDFVAAVGERLGVSRRLLGFEEPKSNEVVGVRGDPFSFTNEWIEAVQRGFQAQPGSWFMEPQQQLWLGMAAFSLPTATYTTTSFDLWLIMSRPRGYTWQTRLQDLEDWRGDPGEAERLSKSALSTAADIASYAEQRFAARGVHVTTVLSGLGSGGVQVEWTVRSSAPHYHLEIEVPPDGQQPIVFLRTREEPDGTILKTQEVRNASMAEAIAEIEKLAHLAERAASAARAAVATAA